MGSYGIGPGRVMGTIIELLSDDKGIVWPSAIAPFDIHLVEIANTDSTIRKKAEEIYTELKQRGLEVLFDDRELRAGEKFADSDLLGIPLRIIVSDKNLAKGELEIKERATGKVKQIKEKDLWAFLKI